jgi:hypothetical protein
VELRGLTYEIRTVNTSRPDRLNGYGWTAQVKFHSESYRVLRYDSHTSSGLSRWFSFSDNQNPEEPALLKLFQGGPQVWIIVMEKKGALEWYQCDGNEPDRSRSHRTFYGAIRDRVWRGDTSEIYVILTDLFKKTFPGFHQSDLHDNSITIRPDALPDGRVVLQNFAFDIDASASPPKSLPPRSEWVYFSRVSFSSKEITYTEGHDRVQKISPVSEKAKSLVPPELSRPLYVGAKEGILWWYDADWNRISPAEYFSARKLGVADSK